MIRAIRAETEISFGAPAVTLQIPRVQEKWGEVTVGEVLASLLDYYQSNAYYSYGGLDEIRELEDAWKLCYMQDVWEVRNAFMCRRTDKGARHFISGAVCAGECIPVSKILLCCVYEEEEAESFGTFTGLWDGDETVDGPKLCVRGAGPGCYGRPGWKSGDPLRFGNSLL